MIYKKLHNRKNSKQDSAGQFISNIQIKRATQCVFLLVPLLTDGSRIQSNSVCPSWPSLCHTVQTKYMWLYFIIWLLVLPSNSNLRIIVPVKWHPQENTVTRPGRNQITSFTDRNKLRSSVRNRKAIVCIQIWPLKRIKHNLHMMQIRAQCYPHTIPNYKCSIKK